MVVFKVATLMADEYCVPELQSAGAVELLLYRIEVPLDPLIVTENAFLKVFDSGLMVGAATEVAAAFKSEC
jgi:hypothetical protein